MKKAKNLKKTKRIAVVQTTRDGCCSASSVWSWTIYVYWFIILFFIAATFYILGRSHEFLHSSTQNVVITEEALIQPQDYVVSAKEKLQSGNIDDAIADLDTAIVGNATSGVYALRGEAYMQIGNYQKALEDFDTAIEKDSMNAIAFYDRALLNTRLENYDAALNDINNALAAQSMKPSESLSMRDLYAKRGQLNLWLKNWRGAVADYTNSLARAEGTISADVYAERAEAYTALGDYENAVNDYTTAIRVISEQIQAAPNQDEREKQSSNAMGYFEKSAALNFKMGNNDAAHSDLESAFALAVALDDNDSADRIQKLLSDLD